MKDEAAIQVRDRGCGIPQHLQEQVFEPDYTSKPGLGTGLGLSIVQHICHQRGGTVALDSEIGKGTSVRVSFPLVREVIHAT
jgi:two-component system NtrC family sensor kinase